jgi:hypothetical protein
MVHENQQDIGLTRGDCRSAREQRGAQQARRRGHGRGQRRLGGEAPAAPAPPRHGRAALALPAGARSGAVTAEQGLETLAQGVGIMSAQTFVGNIPDEAVQPAFERGATLGGVDGRVLRLTQPKHVDERFRRRQHGGNGRRAAGTGEIVRVLALRQQSEPQRLAGAYEGQSGVERAIGRLAARLVAVETEDRLLAHLPQEVALIRRQGGAERGDRLREAGDAHRDHVDIALDGDDIAGVMRGLAGAMVVVEAGALVEQARLGRVEVFRLGVLVHGATAEGDHAAGAVADREHHPVAKAIVRHGDILAMDEQPGLDHRVDRGAASGEMITQGVFLVRRVAEAEVLLDRRRQAAIGQIAARFRAGAILQLRLEPERRQLQHVAKRGAPLLAFDALLGLDRHLQAGHAGQPLHRLGEAQPLRLHQEGEGVAMLSRREVVIETLLIVDIKRRRLFRLERRQAAPLAPLLLQLDARAHDFRHRKPRPDFIEKGRRKFHVTPWLVVLAARSRARKQ